MVAKIIFIYVQGKSLKLRGEKQRDRNLSEVTKLGNAEVKIWM